MKKLTIITIISFIILNIFNITALADDEVYKVAGDYNPQ